jgi:hypothetical protein
MRMWENSVKKKEKKIDMERVYWNTSRFTISPSKFSFLILALFSRILKIVRKRTSKILMWNFYKDIRSYKVLIII